MGKIYTQYDADILKKLQSAELEILSVFIKICDEHNLDYFMFAGSGIGVVRHQGFIPWDDDIDVGMPRKDYDKFIEIANKDYKNEFEVLTPISDKKYACNVTHFQMNGTSFVPYSSKKLKCQLGICIDLFPFDNIPYDEIKKQKQIRKTWILGRLIYLRGCGTPIIPFKGLKKVIAQIICYSAHLFLKIFRVSPKWLFTKFEKESQKYNDTPSETLNTFVDPFVSSTYITKDELYPLCKMPFENITVKMPNNYHNQLSRIFGDYMIVPPVEKRINHCPYKIEFPSDTRTTIHN